MVLRRILRSCPCQVIVASRRSSLATLRAFVALSGFLPAVWMAFLVELAAECGLGGAGPVNAGFATALDGCRP